MIECQIDDSLIELSRKRQLKMGVLAKSFTQGRGSLYGFIGEYLALSVVGGELADTFDYDIMSDLTYTYDVKTKKVSSIPKPHYECSVSAYQRRQKCEAYIFCRVLKDMSKGWVLGWMPKDEYFEKSRFLMEGDRDGVYTVRESCYNLPISQLMMFPEDKYVPDQE
jgi:hypothetical protein